MRLLFLIPLTTAIISNYLFQNCTQEMAYLTGTIAIVSLIISLFIAPWQVQLIIIIFAIIMARQDWRQLQKLDSSEEVVNADNESKTTKEKEISSELPKENINKYRGADYTLSSFTANVIPGEIQGKYRGNPLQSSKLSQSFFLNRKSKLKYRGADINSDT